MLQQSSRLAAAWKERLHGAAVRARAARCAAPDFVAHDLLAIVKRRVDAAARAARPVRMRATRARGGPCPVICICASCTNRNLLDVHVSCDSQTHSHHKTTRIDRGPSRRARARTRPRADPLTIERRGHVMTSRRAASIASRFSSRFSSRYSARLSPPLAPPTPRLRWAAALAVAYLAVAGCAAGRQREPGRRAGSCPVGIAGYGRGCRPRLGHAAAAAEPALRRPVRRGADRAALSRPEDLRRRDARWRSGDDRAVVSATEIAAGLLAEGVRRPAFHAAAGRRRAAEPDAAPAHRLAGRSSRARARRCRRTAR